VGVFRLKKRHLAGGSTMVRVMVHVIGLLWLTASAAIAQTASQPLPGDRMLADYFRAQTARLRDACLADIKSLDDWKSRRGEYRRQLLEMLSLDPLPEKTDLKPVVTGKVEAADFLVEKLHFQSRPGLYVTANLYLPKRIEKPVPAILYLCGHGAVKKDGVSFGNKVHYQHHGIWFARHGYACLVLDSLQLGEIEGIHHGTHRFDMWWWNSRGYTPAGVEAWNCVRALDYLQSRSEIDPERIGATGRSGGGAYSWFIAAIDDRIKVAVPVAGITDLENHVVDGVVEGHCDCMYFVNTYRWDYPQLAAMVAPRPLLISNTDKDKIFPLEGVLRTHEKVRRIYKLHDAEKNLGLHITEGPHADTQELYTHAFVWFDRFLKGASQPIDGPAVKQFEPEQLKVFDKLPEDQINTKIHETFVPAVAPPEVPKDKNQWVTMRDAWMKALREKVFRGWPETPGDLNLSKVFDVEREGIRFAAYDFDSQPHVRLRLFMMGAPKTAKANTVDLDVLDSESWQSFLEIARPVFADQLQGITLPDANVDDWKRLRNEVQKNGPCAWVAPRGVGLSGWDIATKKQLHNRRRFMLLGQTLAGMQVYDARRAIAALRSIQGDQGMKVALHGQREMAVAALYASLFEPKVSSVTLIYPPVSHDSGPDALNVRRYLDLPAAAALVADRAELTIYAIDPSAWKYVSDVKSSLGWEVRRANVQASPEK
jgi:cephalosporin-C deacetylase-like acetyl esterase